MIEGALNYNQCPIQDAFAEPGIRASYTFCLRQRGMKCFIQ